MKQTDYKLMAAQLKSLTEGVPHMTANWANASALIYDMLDTINWAGFYFLQGEILVLGPFQGKPACIEIPIGKGVCGTAAALDAVQRVPDVHAFPGHIACDSDSRSEIVVPIHRDGKVTGVLDLDSPVPDRFSPEDQELLEGFVRIMEEERLG